MSPDACGVFATVIPVLLVAGYLSAPVTRLARSRWGTPVRVLTLIWTYIALGGLCLALAGVCASEGLPNGAAIALLCATGMTGGGVAFAAHLAVARRSPGEDQDE